MIHLQQTRELLQREAYFERKMVFDVDEVAGNGGGHGGSRELDLAGQIKRLRKVREKAKVKRDAIITKDAAEAILSYLASEREADAEVWNGARPLFLSVPFQAKKRDDSRKGRMSTRTISYVVKKIAVYAQVEGVHPHRFRHHVGYLMNERGGITAVQKQLGHRNIAYSAGYCQRTDDELAGYLEGK